MTPRVSQLPLPMGQPVVSKLLPVLRRVKKHEPPRKPRACPAKWWLQLLQSRKLLLQRSHRLPVES